MHRMIVSEWQKLGLKYESNRLVCEVMGIGIELLDC